MKSSERKTSCPVCKKEVCAERLKLHISRVARLETESNLQKDKPHCNYNIVMLREKQK